MRNKGVALAALAILIAVGSGCLGTTSSTTVKGRVMKDGKPVEGAKVVFTGRSLEEMTMLTSDDGRFVLTLKHRPSATLEVTAEKPGMTQKWHVLFVPFEEIPEEVTVEMIDSIPAT
jgi:hypothetical protein